MSAKVLDFPVPRVAHWVTDRTEIDTLMKRVTEWGYPRDLNELDERSWWFTFGEDLIWWFQPTEVPHWMGWHMAIAPASQCRIFARPYLTRVRVAAELFQVSRLYVQDPPEKVREYLVRLGFENDAHGQFLEVT